VEVAGKPTDSGARVQYLGRYVSSDIIGRPGKENHAFRLLSAEALARS
jgi:hypothetical protein